MKRTKFRYIKTTELENRMLEVIFETDYMDCDETSGPPRFGTWLWLDEFSESMGITVQQIKGVLTSLKKKNLVKTYDEGTSEAVVNFTETGYYVYLSTRGD